MTSIKIDTNYQAMSDEIKQLQESPQPQVKTGWFTKENAAEMAKRKAAMHNVKVAAKIITADEGDSAEAFRIQRLARVRIQLTRLDKQLEEETDPSRLDRLMSALNRLQEAEGWLAGRAKPGNLKPITPKAHKGRSSINPPPEPEDSAS